MLPEIAQGLKVLYPIKKGSSNPVVVEASNGQHYLVKLRSSQSSPYAAPCDYLACRLGHAAGLPVVEPALVELSETTVLDGLDDEMRDAVVKSCGINLAYVFIENAVPPQLEAVQDADLLFAFDCFLLNIDRTIKNPNLLAHKRQVVAFDYEASMLFMGLLQDLDFGRSGMALQELRKNYLYRPGIGMDVFKALFDLLQLVDPASICGYPESWSEAIGEPHLVLQKRLFGGLRLAIQQPETCWQRYEQLAFTPLQTETERQEIVDANRKRFEDDMKKMG